MSEHSFAINKTIVRWLTYKVLVRVNKEKLNRTNVIMTPFSVNCEGCFTCSDIMWYNEYTKCQVDPVSSPKMLMIDWLWPVTILCTDNVEYAGIRCKMFCKIESAFLFRALHYAAGLSGPSDVLEILVAHGAEIDVVNNEGCTPLFFATQSNNKFAACVLISQGANVRQKNTQGWLRWFMFSSLLSVECLAYRQILIIQYHIPIQNGIPTAKLCKQKSHTPNVHQAQCHIQWQTFSINTLCHIHLPLTLNCSFFMFCFASFRIYSIRLHHRLWRVDWMWILHWGNQSQTQR